MLLLLAGLCDPDMPALGARAAGHALELGLDGRSVPAELPDGVCGFF